MIINPKGANERSYKVPRGGSWYTSRYCCHKGLQFNDRGFRVVMGVKSCNLNMGGNV